jgi:Predicted O-linked N-acetylglucosamine transferase, SPINDLY family
MNLKAENSGVTGVVVKLAGLLVELERMPIIYESTDELEHYWNHYNCCLNQALELVAEHSFDRRDTEYLRSLLFRITNFYLAYQQKDVKESLAKFSKLACKILKPEIGEFDSKSVYEPREAISRSERTETPPCQRKIRFGIASEFLYNHNGSFWAYQWLSNLPREDYEFYCYSFNRFEDEISRKFEELGTFRRLVFRPENYLEALRVIWADALDILLLPDVGMGSANSIVALTRLAPVQCASWGHPVTTGSASIDFYLSGDLMETDDSARFFTEKLVTLPNVGYCFEEPDMPLPMVSRVNFGLPPDRVLFGCIQSHFKYLPQFDFVYPEIAKLFPDALFVFVDSKNASVTTKFKSRLAKSFVEAGLDFDNSVHFLPRMPRAQFLSLLRLLDVNLDSVGWNGGITTVRSIAANLLVLTIPGEFMRSRHSYSMLRMIGLDELIVNTLDEYVSVAARLGREVDFRAKLVQSLKERKSRLFQDLECVAALDHFIKTEVEKRRSDRQN